MTLHIKEYFQKFTYQDLPDHGTPPDEVVWCDVGEVEIRGARLCACDPWAMPAHDSVTTDVVPGNYQVKAECFAYGSDGRVARLTVQLVDSTVTGKEEVGGFGVDVASAGIADADAMERFLNSNELAHEEWQDSFIEHQCEKFEIAGFFPHEAAGTEMIHVSTGFGDGWYKAYQLIEGEKGIGIEVVFLSPNQGYFDLGEAEK